MVHKVWPDKVYYKPGETMKVDIEVSNPDVTAASAQLKIELIHDIDSTQVLSDAAVTVEPKSTKSFSFTTIAQPVLGIETRATLSRDGKALSTQSEYCTCARTVSQVLVAGLGNTLMSGNMKEQDRDATIAYYTKMYRQYYGNYWEWFAWAPSDYDDMTPDTNRWWAGQAQYNESLPVMQAMNKILAAQGTQVFTYGKAAGGGALTYEFLRKHPEWASYFDGRPSLENYDAAHLDYLSTIGPPKENEERGLPGKPEEMEKAGYAGAAWFAPFINNTSVWNSVWYDSNNDDVVKHGSDEMGKSALQLGFQGVRFDGEFATMRHRQLDGSWNAPPAFDADAADARLIRNMKQWTWKYKPDYLFAYNTALNFRWNIKADNTPVSFREKCKDEGLIAREEMAFPGNVPWEDYIKVVRHDSDITRYYGGHSALYPFLRNPRFLYPFIIAYALRSHQMMGFVSLPDLAKPPLARFVTRWAAQLWDDSVHTWSQATSEISVSADRKLWWDQFAATRQLKSGKSTQFLIHLINPPEGKTTLGDNGEGSPEKVPENGVPKAPAKNVEVRWTKPRGFKRAFVADLDRNDLQPVAARTAGSTLVFTIPEIGHWSILMIEADRPTPAPVWELTKEEANLKLPTAQDLGIAQTGAVRTKWSQVLQSENYFPNPRGVTDRAMDLDAEDGAALHAEPGRPLNDYMAVGTYFFPRTPGHYLAKFRLKVEDNTIDKPIIKIAIQETNENAMPGVPSLSTPVTVLKGTDFKAANTYQEFEVPFDHSDVGFHAMYASYVGNGEVWWDQTSLELLQPWTAAELEKHYASLKPPADLQIVRDAKTDVLFIRGLWNRTYKIDDAVARLPGEVLPSSAYTSYSQTSDTTFRGLNFDWSPLYKQDVVVLADVETRGLPFGKVKMLQQWVRDGGGLVILGGLLTLGLNCNLERGWPVLLPILLNGPY
jgi:hypothetical protein